MMLLEEGSVSFLALLITLADVLAFLLTYQHNVPLGQFQRKTLGKLN